MASMVRPAFVVGVVGSSIAAHAARLGLNVLLLEKEDIASGALERVLIAAQFLVKETVDEHQP